MTDVDLAGAGPGAGSRSKAGASAAGPSGSAAADPECATDPGWTWRGPEDGIPADAPLPALLLAASRVMGAFYA
ncbi:MAG: hypothetical protein ACRDOB_23995, partial [Streptosporangiaceae bacterium]